MGAYAFSPSGIKKHNMIYYLILFGIIILNIKLKKGGGFYFWVGFYLFLIGSIIDIFGLPNFAEIFMRICLIFLISGFAFSIKEYFNK